MHAIQIIELIQILDASPLNFEALVQHDFQGQRPTSILDDS